MAYTGSKHAPPRRATAQRKGDYGASPRIPGWRRTSLQHRRCVAHDRHRRGDAARVGAPLRFSAIGPHRRWASLYSQQEITRLRWVKLRMDEGMQIRQAIRALHHFEQEGAALRAPATSTAAAAGEAGADSLSVLQQRLFNALLQRDAALADQVLADAEVLFPLESLILDVIGPIFAAIGEAWSVGRVGRGRRALRDAFFAPRRCCGCGTATGVPGQPAILACAQASCMKAAC